MSKTYWVSRTVISTEWSEVEADSEEEALNLAEMLDDEAWEEDDNFPSSYTYNVGLDEEE